jgi:hypothetical protein
MSSKAIHPKHLNPVHFPPLDEYGEKLEYRKCHYCGDIYDQHDSQHSNSKCYQAEKDLGRA